ncbi:hypothetical protein IT575_05545 [bacterium]|nr:hypothetical protein [bacterium]
MRKLVFPLYIISALLLALAVCSVLWKQHLDHKMQKRKAQEIADLLGWTAFDVSVQDGTVIPPDMAGVVALLDAGSLPENHLTGKPVVEVGLFQQTQPFDVTYLRGRSRTDYVEGTDSNGNQTYRSVEDLNSPVVLVYGPPGFKGLDVDGDSLPDAVLAYYPSIPIDQENGIWRKISAGLASRVCEPLELTVRRERDRLLAESKQPTKTEGQTKEH